MPTGVSRVRRCAAASCTRARSVSTAGSDAATSQWLRSAVPSSFRTKNPSPSGAWMRSTRGSMVARPAEKDETAQCGKQSVRATCRSKWARQRVVDLGSASFGALPAEPPGMGGVDTSFEISSRKTYEYNQTRMYPVKDIDLVGL